MKNSHRLRARIPLSRRKIVKKSINRMARPLFVVAAVTLGIAWVLQLFLEAESINFAELLVSFWQPLLVVFSVALVWLASYPIYQYLYWRTYYYDMDEENIHIRKGVTVKRETILPFSRITDVYLDQDFLDVVFGIYNLRISTPTLESREFAHIDGLSWYGAARLRRLLLSKINKTGIPTEIAETREKKKAPYRLETLKGHAPESRAAV